MSPRSARVKKATDAIDVTFRTDRKHPDGRGIVDEIIIAPGTPVYLHLEQMHNGCYWMTISSGRERKVFWFNSSRNINLTHEPEE